MHLLRIAVVMLCTAALFYSCKSGGPTTPEETFNLLKGAYSNSDAGELEKLLSAGGLRKAQAIIRIFSLMNEEQLKALGKKFKVTAGTLKNLSVKEFLNLQLLIAKTNEDDLSGVIVTSKMTGVDINNRKAVVRLDNGMELTFVKEGPYWKYDIEELSSVEIQQ